ncbi:hypothetical protein F4054_16070 [Candidatus Poribacteria bacterium]|nr:hypothetical protein [Candidatus Poribacteria bacterium]MYB93747.1 hypothetical protein [Candidatus Poribacteria bacterium]MYG05668.1 hypothetical protein [Candidatus Poribacteria bacterium]MYK23760.1 hypothetical protein [Candidatus Poribacteria bacterium]
MFKRNWHWALVVLIILGIGSFVVFRPKAQVGTVKVYKTVTPTPKPALTETSETDRRSDVQTQSLSETAAVPTESEAVETFPMDETETQAVPPPEKSADSEATAIGAAKSEKRYFGDYTEEELEQIRDWGKDLDARLMEKYPEFAALTRMTPEEIAEKYPTHKDRRQLAKLGQELLNEYTEEMGAFLVTLPAPIRTSLLNEIRSELSINWGQKAADLTMEKLSDLMK